MKIGREKVIDTHYRITTVQKIADIVDTLKYETSKDTSEDHGNILTKQYPSGIMRAPTTWLARIIAQTIKIFKSVKGWKKNHDDWLEKKEIQWQIQYLQRIFLNLFTVVVDMKF